MRSGLSSEMWLYKVLTFIVPELPLIVKHLPLSINLEGMDCPLFNQTGFEWTSLLIIEQFPFKKHVSMF